MDDINYKSIKNCLFSCIVGGFGSREDLYIELVCQGGLAEEQSANNRFFWGYILRIGIEFATKTVTLQDGGKIQASIWDTAGQERYRAITTNHFRNAGGALLIYDITKEKTFENLTKWIDDLQEMADKNVVMFVVGNKLDLVERSANQRKVSLEEGQEFAKKNGCFFEETSAYKGTNISTCFERLIEEMYLRKHLYMSMRPNEKLKPIETPLCSKC